MAIEELEDVDDAGEVDPSAIDEQEDAQLAGSSNTETPQNTTQETKETTTPSLTPEEAMARLAEYEQQLASLKPLQEVGEKNGGLEGLQPAIDLTEALINPQPNFDTVLDTMALINPEIVSPFLWHVVDKNLGLIAQDQQVRQAILGNDPEYQQFLRYKEQGYDFSAQQEEEVDPETAKLRQELDALKQQQESAKQEALKQQQEAQRAAYQQVEQQYNEKNVFGYLNEQLGKLNFGEENKAIAPLLGHMVCTAFDNDPNARVAYQRAANLARVVGNNEQHPQKAQLEAATKAMQNHLARHFKAVTEPLNRLVQKAHGKTVSTIENQVDRSRHIGSSTPDARTVLSGLSNANDPYVKAQALLDRARTEGRVQGYGGY